MRTDRGTSARPNGVDLEERTRRTSARKDGSSCRSRNGVPVEPPCDVSFGPSEAQPPHFHITGRTDMVPWGLPTYSIHIHFLRHGVAETWVSDYPESGSFTAMCAIAHSPSVGHVVAASRSAPNAWRKTSGESAMMSRGCARIAAG